MSGDELYAYTLIYHFVDIFILTPAAIIIFLTGLIFSIFTKWGFIRHGWIIYKWVITLALILIGTFYLGPMTTRMLEIVDGKRFAALQDSYFQQGTGIGFWAGIFNVSLLIVAVFFTVYKPWKNIDRKV